MDIETTGRELTYDEKKAAEAAFTGRPFNPEWSEAARKVYDGIVGVMGSVNSVADRIELQPAEPVA
ncbi:MAG TPA: hypothetical protein VJ805_05035 [Nitrospiraceae bacterium]|nr:hypothetical protein [Nitrospiraceae bacterium]